MDSGAFDVGFGACGGGDNSNHGEADASSSFGHKTKKKKKKDKEDDGFGGGFGGGVGGFGGGFGGGNIDGGFGDKDASADKKVSFQGDNREERDGRTMDRAFDQNGASLGQGRDDRNGVHSAENHDHHGMTTRDRFGGFDGGGSGDRRGGDRGEWNEPASGGHHSRSGDADLNSMRRERDSSANWDRDRHHDLNLDVGRSSDRGTDRFEDSMFTEPRGAHRDTFAIPAPPSALDSAYGMVARRRQGGNGDTYSRAELGLADVVDRNSPEVSYGGRSASLGFDGNPGSSNGASVHGSKPLRDAPRGFSFSLTDLPEASLGRSPYYTGNGQPRGIPTNTQAKWNPLNGIKRHWGETMSEVSTLPTSSESVACNLPGTLCKSGGLEEEISRSEVRAQALRKKIGNLEASLLGPDSRTSERGGLVKVVVPTLLDGGRLGLTMKETIVSNFADPRAQHFGWMLGDRVVSVNSTPVSGAADFTVELQRAVNAHRATGRPLIFDVQRHRSDLHSPAGPYHLQGSRPASPVRTYTTAPVLTSPVASPAGSYVPPVVQLHGNPAPPAIHSPMLGPPMPFMPGPHCGPQLRPPVSQGPPMHFVPGPQCLPSPRAPIVQGHPMPFVSGPQSRPPMSQGCPVPFMPVPQCQSPLRPPMSQVDAMSMQLAALSHENAMLRAGGSGGGACHQTRQKHYSYDSEDESEYSESAQETQFLGMPAPPPQGLVQPPRGMMPPPQGHFFGPGPPLPPPPPVAGSPHWPGTGPMPMHGGVNDGSYSSAPTMAQSLAQSLIQSAPQPLQMPSSYVGANVNGSNSSQCGGQFRGPANVPCSGCGGTTSSGSLVGSCGCAAPTPSGLHPSVVGGPVSSRNSCGAMGPIVSPGGSMIGSGVPVGLSGGGGSFVPPTAGLAPTEPSLVGAGMGGTFGTMPMMSVPGGARTPPAMSAPPAATSVSAPSRFFSPSISAT